MWVDAGLSSICTQHSALCLLFDILVLQFNVLGKILKGVCAVYFLHRFFQALAQGCAIYIKQLRRGYLVAVAQT